MDTAVSVPKSQEKKRRRRQRRRQQNIPMAKPRRSGRKTMKTKRGRNDNEIVVSGRDLVVPSPRSLPLGESSVNVFQCVPANPVYWTGTRLSRLAQQYQLYRPLKFVVHYHPQVPVTNPGLVVYGTLMQDASLSDSELQQVLNTSNGGGIKECYSAFTSRVNVSGSFLQMSSYNVVGEASTTANLPFCWVATYSGYSSSAISTSSTPGWVEVEWTYKLMNGNPGTGNSAEAIYVADETALQRTMLRLGHRAPRNSLLMPFGIPIGLIKDLARPLLRHVSVFLLNGATVGSVRFGIGKVLGYVADNLLSRRNDITSAVRDDDGSIVNLPDTTPVVLLMSGLPQAASTAPVDDTFPLYLLTIGGKDYQIRDMSTLPLPDLGDLRMVAAEEDDAIEWWFPVGQHAVKIRAANEDASITQHVFQGIVEVNGGIALELTATCGLGRWAGYQPNAADVMADEEEEDISEDARDVEIRLLRMEIARLRGHERMNA